MKTTADEHPSEEIVLVVDDEDAVRTVLRASLAQEGIACHCAGSAEEALALLERRPFDAMLCDVRMPGMTGMQLLTTVRRRWPETPVIMLTAHGNVRLAVEAMKEGAMEFLAKPFNLDEVLALVRRALVVSARQRNGVPSIPVLSSGPEARSPIMREAEGMLLRAAQSDCTVLLLGESGVGKEVAARLVHARSARSAKPFVAVHCGALPDQLLESELFGYERGAFTGAGARKPGRLELAAGGTLFLDEIGDISLSAQVKLLRVLQEKTFERLGGVTTLRADLRFVAATHRNLSAMVEQGTFREDLYYRLSVCPVRVPPLRERPEDITALVQHFARVHCESRAPVTFDDAALDLLARQRWPGNLRELQNFVERMVLFADVSILGAAAVLDEIERRGGAAGAASRPREPERSGAPSASLQGERRGAERQAIERALERAGGNRTQAARLLGVSRRTLYNKLAEYGME